MIVVQVKPSRVQVAGKSVVHSATPRAGLDGLAIGKPWRNAKRTVHQGQQILELIAERMVIRQQNSVEGCVGQVIGVVALGAAQRSTSEDVAMVIGDEAATHRNTKMMDASAPRHGHIREGSGATLAH